MTYRPQSNGAKKFGWISWFLKNQVIFSNKSFLINDYTPMPYLIIYFCYYFGLIKDIVYNLCKQVSYLLWQIGRSGFFEMTLKFLWYCMNLHYWQFAINTRKLTPFRSYDIFISWLGTTSSRLSITKRPPKKCPLLFQMKLFSQKEIVSDNYYSLKTCQLLGFWLI